jgi:tetratricopeptide (TPR) repeat protein
MELDVLSKQIIGLRWEKDFDGALNLVRAKVHGRFTIQELKLHPKLVCAIIDCLKETGKVAEAMAFVEKYLRITPTCSILDSANITLGWLYFFALNAKQPYVNEIAYSTIDLIKTILGKLSKNQDAKLFELLLLRLLEYLGKRPNPNWEALGSLMDEFEYNQLSEAPVTIKQSIKGKEKSIELASSREKWFIWRTKAAYGAGRYEQCIAQCHQALAAIERFHHGNQHWLTHRIALSYQHLGQHQRAIHGLEKLLAKRNEWFIQRELTNLYFQAKDFQKALDIGLQACANGGLSEYKTGLFELMGKIYEAKGDLESGTPFFQLAITIRNEQGWKVSDDLLGKFSPVSRTDSNTQYQILAKQWGAIVRREDEILHSSGHISRVLHEGANGDGFITTSQGVGVYFRFSQARIRYSDLKVGLQVSFKAKQVERNNRKVWNATQVFKVSP